MGKTKRIFMAAIAFMLALITMILLPTQVVAETITTEVTENVSDNSTTLSGDSNVQGNIIGEDVSLRDEYTKYFVTDTGCTIVAQYEMPVHYKDDKGEFVEYDNSLESSQVTADISTADESSIDEASTYGLRNDSQLEDVFVNKKSKSKVSHFKNSGRVKLTEITSDGYTISWSYSGSNSVAAVEESKDSEELTGNDEYITLDNLSSQVNYENIYNNIDLEVINSTVGVKENLILKASNAKNVFKIDYNIGELVAECVDENTIELKNSEGRVVYTISAPYMVDANGETSEALELKILSNNKGKLSVKLTTDKTWLKDNSRVYPVTIDPTVNYRGTSTDVSCTYIYSKEADTERSVEQFFFVGTNSDEENDEKRGLIKINNLPKLGIGDMIVDVQAGLYLCPIGNLFTTSYVGFYEMTEDWTESNKGTWNSVHDSYDNNLIDYEKVVANQEEGWITWNITELAKKWYADPDSNNGFMVKMVDGTSVNQDIRFTSPTFSYDDESLQIARPTFLITYRSNKGIENYWSYTTIDCGRAGTAYINDYSGNLVFEMPLASTASPTYAATLSCTYNSYLADKKYYVTTPHTGKGWRMNVQQTLLPSSTDLLGTNQPLYPYIYTDADGTEHYFKKVTEDSETKYYDEDGLNLELIIGTSYYQIVDEKNNSITFNTNGYLESFKDESGNTVKINYKSDDTNRIEDIEDNEGNKISLAVNDNTNKYVDIITDSDGKTIDFDYGTNARLAKVTYNDGTFISYGYDSTGRLTSVTDVDGAKVVFGYTNNDSKGVISVAEYGADGTLGQKMTFNRSKYNITTVRTSGVDDIYGTDDDIITEYLYDNWGRATSSSSKTAAGKHLAAAGASYTSGSSNSTGSNIKSLNKLTKNYSIGSNNQNLVTDGSFENADWDTKWNSKWWNNSDITYTTSHGTSKLYGNQSLVINTTQCSSTARARVYQDIPVAYLEQGETYTLSGYIKTSDLTPVDGATTYGAYLCATLFNSDNTTSSKNSNFITTDTYTGTNNGFRRVSVSFTVPTSSDFSFVRVNLALRSATGTACFEGIQLEKSEEIGTFNLLENADLERYDSSGLPTSWSSSSNFSISSTTDTKTSNAKVDGTYCFRIKGNVAQNKYLYQEVPIDTTEHATYILSGWATANSVPKETNSSSFRLLARVYYTDGDYDNYNFYFNSTLRQGQWQYASGAFSINDGSTDKIVDKLVIYLVYNKQGNYAYFDNIQLTKEPVPSYTYDKEGNLETVVANSEQSSNYEYTDAENNITPKDNLLTKYINPNEKEYTYTYYDNKQIKTVTAPSGLVASYTYDDKGNANSVELSSGDLKLSESLTYTYSNGSLPNYSVKATDQRGMTSTWRYDAKDGTLTGYTDPNGNSTTYTYNTSNDTLRKITSGDQGVSYTYDSNYKHRTGITHGNTTYTFTYDEFGNAATTSVGNHTLATNTYYGNNGKLKMLTYGNGDYVSYSYDEFGNIFSITKNNSIVAKFHANDRGDIIRTEDKINNLEYRANYDTTGRLISKDVYNSSKVWQRSVEYDYDNLNNLTKLSFTDNNGSNFTTHYSYDSSNRPFKSVLQSGKTFRYYYDGLNRVTKSQLNTTTPIITNYSNINIGSDTTSVIDTEVSNAFAYSYYYDSNGNIIAIRNGTEQSNGSYTYSASSGHKYEYDRYNQLVTDIDYANERVTYYTYDANGNLTSKLVRDYNIEGSYPMGVLESRTYLYSDANGWGDLLTSWGGQTITYDEIGNPLTYRDGMTMEWQNGRELAMCDYGTSYNVYKYDLSGLRTMKTIVGPNGYIRYVKYVYENGLLLQMDYDGYVFNFSYDANGSPIGFHVKCGSYIDAYYYYGVNSRGDVEALYNADGTIYARYEYDAYGKLLGITDVDGYTISSAYDIAVLNPLRYRGYVYDTETGFYYLQSRYYDPTTCRFINADAIATTSSGLNGLNLFAYCSNNPIMYSDPAGYCPVYIPSCPACNDEVKALHDERGADWATKGVYVKPTTTEPSFFEKCGQTLEMIYYSAYLEIGVGYGLGCSIGVGNLSIDGVINSDLIHADFSSDGPDLGMNCNISVGPSAYGKSIPMLNFYDCYYKSYITGVENESFECPNDFVIVDLSFYCIIGVTFAGGWDGQKISDGFSNIWGI